MTGHSTPRMGNMPHDPAYELLTDEFRTTPRVYRDGCYICRDMEYARMGLPLCSQCCVCSDRDPAVHIAADEGECDDCGHEACEECLMAPGQQGICTCGSPCCEVDIGVGVMTCTSQHCPSHGISE